MSYTGNDQAFTVLDISIQCRKLPKLDPLSQSDPFCVLFSVPSTTTYKRKKSVKNTKAEPIFIIPKLPKGRSFKEVEIGRTETIQDNKNPEFTKSFTVEYHFEEEQRFVLRVYDEDAKGDRNLRKHDYLGATTFTLGQLMGARGNTLARPLGVGKGCAIIRAEEISSCRDVLQFQLSGQGLKNKDGIFGKSDPFLVISRMNKTTNSVMVSWNQVWKSEMIRNNLNPRFKMAKVPLATICNGDVDRPIQIKIMDWDHDGSHDDMGRVNTTVRELLDRKKSGNPSFDVMYDKRKRGKVKTVPYGTLTVQHAELVQVPTFAQYLSGGCELSLMVAVDFTASNGRPGTPSSLHYQDSYGRPNQYQAAMQSIGTILQEYDTDKQFPIWGFGGKVNGVLSHCFQVGANAEVQGVKGLLDAYGEAFNYGVELYGPTLFSSVIQAATAHAEMSMARNDHSYNVLLILTDGVIHDMDATIDLVCKASSDVPLSIIIVGVGKADFSAMERLDGDEGQRLRNSHGVRAERDIVQFVPFNRFQGSVSNLAAETLAEVPGQLVQFFTARGIKPRPQQPAPSFDDMEIEFSPGDYVEDEIELNFAP